MSFTTFDERIAESYETFFDTAYVPGTSTVIINDGQARRFDAIYLGNADVVDHVVGLSISNGTIDLPCASIVVPAGAGVGGVPPIDIVALQANANLLGFVIPRGGGLNWLVEEAIGVTGFVTLATQGGVF